MASSFVSHCGSGEKFRDQTYPLFARYIKGQGVDPENPKCVVVAVFFKNRCHLLEAGNFEGLNPEALHLPAFAKDRFSVRLRREKAFRSSGKAVATAVKITSFPDEFGFHQHS